MTPERIAQVRAEIERLIPDGSSVLYRLGRDRTCSRAEWAEMREYYTDRVVEFYDQFAPVWEAIPEPNRIRICRQGGYCMKTSQEVAALDWGRITLSVKRLIYSGVATYEPSPNVSS